jgi:hypothetical protein
LSAAASRRLHTAGFRFIGTTRAQGARSEQKFFVTLPRKKFCNDFRSDAQPEHATSIDAHSPGVHNALTSLQLSAKGNGRGPEEIFPDVKKLDA